MEENRMEYKGLKHYRSGEGYMTTTLDGKTFRIRNGDSIGRPVGMPDKPGKKSAWQRADGNDPWIVYPHIYNSIGQPFWPVKVDWSVIYDQGQYKDGYMHTKWIRTSRIDRQEFIRLLREGAHIPPKYNRPERSLCGLNIPFPDLAGVDFSRTDLLRAHFRQGLMREMNFYGSGLTAATFYNCDLSYCCFDLSSLTFTTFYGCDLTGATFTMVNVGEGTSFIKCRGLDLAGSLGKPMLVHGSQK
jgi:hypothetical protein